MKNFFYLIFSALAFASLFSCEGGKVISPDSTDASVSIETVSVSSDGLVFRLVPNEQTESYVYGVGSDDDFKNFLSGNLQDGLAENFGNEPVEISRTDLVPNEYYVIYAKAYGKDGVEGSSSSKTIFLSDEFFVASRQYVSDCSGAVKFTFTSACFRFEYYMGKASDKEDFLAGKLDVVSREELVDEYTVNYFDLKPDSEYMMFARGYDRAGKPGNLYEIDMSTFAEEEAASVEFEELGGDAFRSRYRFAPNEKCSTIHLLICEEGQQSTMIESNWRGDIVSMLASWASIPEVTGVVTSFSGEILETEYLNQTLTLDKPMEYYALLLDTDGNPASVQYGRFTTPSAQDGAGMSGAEIKIGNITSNGATYTITLNENTMGVLYDTVDGSWYDYVVTMPDYGSYYWHETLLAQGYFWSYGKDEVSYTETQGYPSTKYYVVACPMNVNGPEGWGPLAVVDYTTLGAGY